MRSLYLIFLIWLFLPLRINAQFEASTEFRFKEAEFDVFDVVIDSFLLKNLHLLTNSGQETTVDFIANQGAKASFFISTTSFEEPCKPMGFWKAEGGIKYGLNPAKSGNGNFFLQPNGLFLLYKNRIQIITTEEMEKAEEPIVGFQSGPMLVVNGSLNSNLNSKSTNLNLRSGLGIYVDKEQNSHLLFAVSRVPITFFKLAQFFSEAYPCSFALALTSANCSLHFPYQYPIRPAMGGKVNCCAYLRIDFE